VAISNPWKRWVSQNFNLLEAGGQVEVPRCLPPLKTSGFEQPPLAEPVGQVGDWVLPLRDGSRLHVHTFPGGRRVAHRDRIDPGRGFLPAVAHWVTESRSGQVTLLSLALFGLWKLSRT
jgi:hypothetical protein